MSNPTGWERLPDGCYVNDGCSRGRLKRGLCSKHYSRWRKHGDVTAYHPGARPKTLEELLVGFGSLTMRAENGCLLWIGNIDLRGYGTFVWKGKRHRAHRFLYEAQRGPVAPGLELDHLCHNQDDACFQKDCLHRRCVEIGHLEPVPHVVNCRRGNTTRLRTTCWRGHLLEGSNIYIYPNGRRRCRTCKRLNSKRWKAMRKAGTPQ